MRRIAVIGTGYVGLVSGTCFAEMGNHVVCCDIDQYKINRLKQGQVPIFEPGLEEMVRRNAEEGRLSFTTQIDEAIQASEIIYIAVGTPMSVTGAADMRYVTDAARTIAANLNGYKVIVNKSTVPVGTGRMVWRFIRQHAQNPEAGYDVVSNPEFLREGSAIKDCMSMERAVIGATSERAARIIEELHKPFNTRIFLTDLESAEMIKYASNGFLATKISFINAMANICERVGADVTEVAQGMGLDSRIGSRFLQAGVGFGGSCFPKDTHALVHMADAVGYDFHLMRSVITTNDQQRMKVVHKLNEVLGELRGRRIAVLGLAFKPNTNDMRDAPSLTIIPSLLQRGAQVAAYDPVAKEEARILLGEGLHYADSPYEALDGADACLILTEWEEVLHLDLDRAKQHLKLPILIDGRNCFSLEQMRTAGFIYHSIGRQAIETAWSS